MKAEEYRELLDMIAELAEAWEKLQPAKVVCYEIMRLKMLGFLVMIGQGVGASGQPSDRPTEEHAASGEARPERRAAARS